MTQAATKAAILVKNLHKSYGNIKALRDVSFSVQAGEVIGLLGPNGAGKTTLMKSITGYIEPDSGRAEVLGYDSVLHQGEAQKRIGYLPENAPVYRDMTVTEYLSFIADMRGLNIGDKKSQAIADAIGDAGLGEYRHRLISTLSKGYRQRVGIAQAILHRPPVLILDEPTTGLDPNQIVEIRALIERLAQHSTVLLSTHILPEVEMTCQRAVIIAGGTVQVDAKLDSLTGGNAAIIAINQSARKSIKSTLSQLQGVDSVESLGSSSAQDFTRWRVTSDTRDDLCPALFGLAKDNDWILSELSPDSRTLETVFRDTVRQ